METKKMERRILTNSEEGFDIESVSVLNYTYDDGLKSIEKYTAKLNQSLNEIKNMEKMIEEKFWEKDLETIKKSIEDIQNLIDTLNKAVEPKMKQLEEEGIHKVDFYKKKENYDRIPHDAQDKRYEVKNKILAQICDDLKIRDIQHPVIMKLRHECFKDEVKQ